MDGMSRIEGKVKVIVRIKANELQTLRELRKKYPEGL